MDDSLDEANETVQVTLSNPTNATLGATTVHTYTINAKDCALPGLGDWTVTEHCVLSGSATAPGNVIVEEDVEVTILASGSLDINFTNFHLLIKNGAKVVIKDGGKIF